MILGFFPSLSGAAWRSELFELKFWFELLLPPYKVEWLLIDSNGFSLKIEVLLCCENWFGSLLLNKETPPIDGTESFDYSANIIDEFFVELVLRL